MDHNNTEDHEDREALRELREGKLEPKRRNSASQHPIIIHNTTAATTTTGSTTAATITALDNFAARDNNNNKNKTGDGTGTNGTESGPKSPLKKTTATDKKAAQQLIAQADEILRQLDDTYLFQSVNSSNTTSSPSQGARRQKHYPTFEPLEILLGPVLGAGSFSCVFQVERFQLKDGEHSNRSSGSKETDTAGHHVNGTNSTVAAGPDSTGPSADKEGTVLSLIGISNAERKDNDGQTKNNPTPSQIHGANDHGLIKDGPSEDNQNNDDADDDDDDTSHCEVETARAFMSKCVRRKGDARYALKRLYRSMSELERARAMIDLALEVKFLSVLCHPNIIKMRAYGAGPVVSPNFFIIMDRLYDTLDQRMVVWSESVARHRGFCFGLSGGDPVAMKQLILDRLIVAYDLAAAFRYMHECKFVYRDMKPENIGFDVRGDVKVFDFGLSKGLAASLKARDGKGHEVYGYNLTPRTGTIPYMAPEIAECKPYDTQCDVFSFAVLLWEILSLRSAFKGYTPYEFLVRVARDGERLSISRRWPPLTSIAIRDSWQYDPQKRPTMARVASLVRGDLDNLTSDIKVRQRSFHMLNRSAHSSYFVSMGARRGTMKADRSDQIQE